MFDAGGAARGASPSLDRAGTAHPGGENETGSVNTVAESDPAIGCARPFTPTGDADRDLSSLRDLCSPGLTALAGTVNRVDLPVDGEREIAIDLPPGDDCLRVGAVLEDRAAADAGARGDRRMLIDLELDRGEQPLAAVRSTHGLSLLPPRGPICLRERAGGRAALRLRLHAQSLAARGAASSGGAEATSVAIGVWHSFTEN